MRAPRLRCGCALFLLRASYAWVSSGSIQRARNHANLHASSTATRPASAASVVRPDTPHCQVDCMSEQHCKLPAAALHNMIMMKPALFCQRIGEQLFMLLAAACTNTKVTTAVIVSSLI
jgi:hypothetical protein